MHMIHVIHVSYGSCSSRVSNDVYGLLDSCGSHDVLGSYGSFDAFD